MPLYVKPLELILRLEKQFILRNYVGFLLLETTIGVR